MTRGPSAETPPTRPFYEGLLCQGPPPFERVPSRTQVERLPALEGSGGAASAFSAGSPPKVGTTSIMRGRLKASRIQHVGDWRTPAGHGPSGADEVGVVRPSSARAATVTGGPSPPGSPGVAHASAGARNGCLRRDVTRAIAADGGHSISIEHPAAVAEAAESLTATLDRF